jgi:hypothetical protein
MSEQNSLKSLKSLFTLLVHKPLGARCALTLPDRTNEKTHIVFSGIAHITTIANILQKAGAVIGKSHNQHALIMHPRIQRLPYRSGKQLIENYRNFDDSTTLTLEHITE